MERTRDLQVVQTRPDSNSPSITLFKVSFSHVTNKPVRTRRLSAKDHLRLKRPDRNDKLGDNNLYQS